MNLTDEILKEFEKRFGCWCDLEIGDKPNHTPSMKCRGALDMDALVAFLRQSIERVEAERKLEAVEVLHKYAMLTTDTYTLDLIETIQKEILAPKASYQPTPEA